MNWNSYDTKYIIKRLIIGFGMLLLFTILTTNKAKANTVSAIINPEYDQITIPDGTMQGSFSFTDGINARPVLRNAGEGYVLINLLVTNTNPAESIREIYVANNPDRYVCDIGSINTYTDSGTQRQIITAKCPVNLDNRGIGWLTIVKKNNYGTQYVAPGQYITFVSKEETPNLQGIIDAINNQVSSITNTIQQQNQQTHQDLQNINNSINNDNVTTSDADDFKNNQAFTDSTGLESVINLPLNMVNSLSNQCEPIQIHIPYLETDATIPCMSTIYRSKFNSLYTLVKLVVNGFLVYRILLKVYELVHEAKQPDEDKLEVIDL